MKESNYKEILAKNNIKVTKQRELVFDILMHSEVPLTVEDIYKQHMEKDNTMSLSTIYRILDVFVGKGLVVKSNMTKANKAVFEVKRMAHNHYLICVKCEKIVTLQSCPIEGYEKLLEEMTEFDVTGHKLEFYGACPQCKQKVSVENNDNR